MEFIIKNIKTFIILIALLIAALVIYIITSEISFGKKIKEVNNNMKVALNDTVRYYHNREGELIAQRDSYQMEAKDFKELADDLGFDKEQLEEQVGNLKNLVNRLEGELRVSGEAETQVRDTIIQVLQGDTLRADSVQVFNWSNDYLSLGGMIRPDRQLTLNYSYKVAFQTTTYWRKEGLFKPLHLVVDVKFDDPNAGAFNINNVVIKPKPKKFYQRNWFWFVGGVASGVILTKL